MRNPTTRLPSALIAAILVLGVVGCAATSEPEGGLPRDFPTDIPIAQPVDSGSRENGSWQIRSEVTDADAQDAALQALLDDGFLIVGESADDAQHTYSLARGDYAVRLAFQRVDDTFSVTYGVLDNSPHQSATRK